MSKDYAKKRRLANSAKRSRSRSYQQDYALMPAWAWMVAGLLLGVALSALGYWKLQQKSNAETRLASVKIEETNPKKAQKKSTEKKPMRFDFYTLLPSSTPEESTQDQAQLDKDDIIQTQALQNLADLAPDEMTPTSLANATAQDVAATSSTPPTQAVATDPHIIQAGSFRNLTQAEELKAQLAISGFEARIQTFKKGDQQTLYRVYLGPFPTKEQAIVSQNKLEDSLRLHSLVIKNRV